MIQGLVFDKDGTLFHFGESWDKWAGGVIENLAKGDAPRKKSICEAVNFDTERQTLLPSSPIIAQRCMDWLPPTMVMLCDLDSIPISNPRLEVDENTREPQRVQN